MPEDWSGEPRNRIPGKNVKVTWTLVVSLSSKVEIADFGLTSGFLDGKSIFVPIKGSLMVVRKKRQEKMSSY